MDTLYQIKPIFRYHCTLQGVPVGFKLRAQLPGIDTIALTWCRYSEMMENLEPTSKIFDSAATG
jgi:hypothetical protein